MKKPLYFLLLLLVVNCQKSKQPSIVQNICECYKIQKDVGMDSKLNNCLKDFNNRIAQLENNELIKQEFETLAFNLISYCEEYQYDFNKMKLSIYKGREELLNIKEKDSLENLIKNQENLSINLSKSAEFKIIEGNLDEAMQLVNRSIKIDNQIQISYYIRSFLHHKNGEFQKAIDDIISFGNLTENDENARFAFELTKHNLEVKVKKTKYNNGYK